MFTVQLYTLYIYKLTNIRVYATMTYVWHPVPERRSINFMIFMCIENPQN